MRYMIIEHFHKNRVKELYAKFDKEGRLLPEGVEYIDSWIDEKVETCYQLMESESTELLQEWCRRWERYAKFQIVPIISSEEARKKVLNT